MSLMMPAQTSAVNVSPHETDCALVAVPYLMRRSDVLAVPFLTAPPASAASATAPAGTVTVPPDLTSSVRMYAFALALLNAVDAVIAAFVEKGYFQLSSDKRSTHKVRIGGGDVRVYVFSDEISKSLAEFPRKDEQPAAAPSNTRFSSFPD